MFKSDENYQALQGLFNFRWSDELSRIYLIHWPFLSPACLASSFVQKGAGQDQKICNDWKHQTKMSEYIPDTDCEMGMS